MSSIQMDLRAEVKKLVTPAKMIMVLWSIVLILVSSNWLMVPAKNSDLEAVKGQVSRLEKALDSAASRVETSIAQLSTKMDKLQSDQQQSREAILRIGQAENVELDAAPAVAQKPARKKKRKSAPAKPTKEASGLFGQPIQ